MLAAMFLFPLFSQAASLYIDPPKSTLFRGDSVTMAVRLDTDEAAGECVNAVDGVLTYSSNLQPVDISIGKSILNMWVEQPTINKENNTITFAGGIPNGYCGRVAGDPRLTNILTEIVFRSPGFTIAGGDADELLGVVSFTDETTAYLNDGRGTKASLNLYSAEIQLEKGTGPNRLNTWKEDVSADTIPPEEFSIGKIEQFPNGDYYVTFVTSDKQTGIDHYEAIEEPVSQFGSFQWGRADAPWVTVESAPVYVLKDQSLNSIIRIKAVDKAGNEYIATIVSDESMRTISRSEMILYSLAAVSLVLFTVFAFFVTRYLRALSSKKKTQEFNRKSNETDNE